MRLVFRSDVIHSLVSRTRRLRLTVDIEKQDFTP